MLEVSGQIPEWLNGSLITNGGGDFDGMVGPLSISFSFVANK